MRGAALALLSILAAGCATGAVPRPFPEPGPASHGDSRRHPVAIEPGPLVGTALSLRGAPYRDGGGDPSGFDCSGFVAYVFAQQGQFVPRTVAEQYQLGAAVARDGILPGDLVFFSTIAPGASHVGIAVSSTEFVHAPSSSGVVRVESLSAGYWASRYVGARRFERQPSPPRSP
jgi:cell wall-associated NlpC family hydrolase